MRAIVAGEPHQRSALQKIVSKPQGVRTEHEVFLNWANDSIAGSVAESSQLLRDVGTTPPTARDDYATSGRGTSPAPTHSPRRGARSASPAPASVAYRAAAGAPLSSGMALAEGNTQEASLGRARSARDLFMSLQAEGPAGQGQPQPLGPPGTGYTYAASKAPPEPEQGPRVISVREYQRGTAVMKPAAPLPFPGVDSLSPGQRKRAQGAAQAAGRIPTAPIAARGSPQPTLADGVTSMITGVRGDLGEIITAPVSPFSSFDNLLDRLVDTPEACFVNPASLPWSPVVVAGRARGPASHKNMRGAFTFRT